MPEPFPPRVRNPALSSPVVRTGSFAAFKARRPAVVYRRRFRYRRRGKAGSKPVAIIATVDRRSLIAAGATEQSRNRGAHDRPNACSISVWASAGLRSGGEVAIQNVLLGPSKP
jgi:hypothetical protein